MLRLVNAGKVAPMSYLADPGSPDFEPGQIAEVYSVTNTQGTTFFCKPYVGGNIVGIIDDIKRGTNNSTLGSGRITVWNTGSGLIYETDQFESFAYRIGDNLFADPSSAKLTAYQTALTLAGGIIAAVIDPPNPNAPHPLLRFEWLYPRTKISMGPGILGAARGRSTFVIPAKTSKSGPATCKCGYINEYADPNQPYECYKCRHNI